MDKAPHITRLKELNLWDLFHYRPELKVLPRILPQEESIEAATAGISAGKRWMVVFGKEAAYFIHVHLVNGQQTRKVLYADMTDFSVRKGLFFGRVVLSLGENTIKLENCHRRTMDRVQQVLADCAEK
ncbi:MAG TPA: hypothetical protein ENN41_04580 [Sediminispirochaeta sp.]|nr:hypothetical protein [Sediminispirochaeta sp.]